MDTVNIPVSVRCGFCGSFIKARWLGNGEIRVEVCKNCLEHHWYKIPTEWPLKEDFVMGREKS